MVIIEPKRCYTENGLAVYISYRYNGKRVYYDLFHADEIDKKEFTPKKDTTLFRVGGHCSDISGYPIICINIEKSLVYFLENYTGDAIQWETRGLKLDYKLPQLKAVD